MHFLIVLSGKYYIIAVLQEYPGLKTNESKWRIYKLKKKKKKA